MSKINKLGPFPIETLPRATVVDVVYNKRMPMVVSGKRKDGAVGYAVIATKDLQIVCVGCFKDGMDLTDDWRCKTCSSFDKHWATTKDKKVRHKHCAPGGLGDVIDAFAADPEQCPPVEVTDEGGVNVEAGGDGMDLGVEVTDEGGVHGETGGDGMDLGAEITGEGGGGVEVMLFNNVPDDVILQEVKRRRLCMEVARELDDDEVIELTKDKGMKLVRNARPQDLVHELRRLECGNWDDYDYYIGSKKRGKPHSSDAVGITIHEKMYDVVYHSARNAPLWKRTELKPMALFESG